MTTKNLKIADRKLAAKLQRCLAIVRRAGKLAVAFSGGVDSTTLLALAVVELGAKNVLAITAAGALFPPEQIKSAARLAKKIGVRQLIIKVAQLSDRKIAANPPDRCYHCKKKIFTAIAAVAGRNGISAVASGANADDKQDYRPGSRAERQMGVLRPLMESGMTKADIRTIARAMKLPVADAPSMACLASRVPYGTPLTAKMLTRIGMAEDVLARIGFSQYRVRDHWPVARIEVPAAELKTALARRDEILRQIGKLGYKYIAVDLAGFRSGSMNAAIGQSGRK